VYPITGFNILFNAYAKSLQSVEPLDYHQYIIDYCNSQYGFNKSASENFIAALFSAPYEVIQGAIADSSMSIGELLDSARLAAKTLASLQPSKNKNEFEHYRLMGDIRVQYLTYEQIEAFVNSDQFSQKELPATLARLKTLLANTEKINQRFLALNGRYFHTEELRQENELRNARIRLLYARLARSK
jgi:hypothetical protein